MASGSSDQVRSVALKKYVQPAMLAGKTKFSVAVRDVMKDLQVDGFPQGNYPQICTALRTGRFLRENGLELEKIDGPPSGLSTTVVLHYKVAASSNNKTAISLRNADQSGIEDHHASEDSGVRAHRLFEGLRGLLKSELAEYGGGESFIRWMRSEDDDEAAAKRDE